MGYYNIEDIEKFEDYFNKLLDKNFTIVNMNGGNEFFVIDRFDKTKINIYDSYEKAKRKVEKLHKTRRRLGV